MDAEGETSEPADTEGRARRTTKRLISGVRDASNRAIEDRPGAKRAHQIAGTAARKTNDATKTAAGKIGEGVDQFARNLSLDDYRAVFERTLDEALDVIHAQNMEIEALRHRIDQLERRAQQ